MLFPVGFLHLHSRGWGDGRVDEITPLVCFPSACFPAAGGGGDGHCIFPHPDLGQWTPVGSATRETREVNVCKLMFYWHSLGLA